jgi:hypothetical protein
MAEGSLVVSDTAPLRWAGQSSLHHLCSTRTHVLAKLVSEELAKDKHMQNCGPVQSPMLLEISYKKVEDWITVGVRIQGHRTHLLSQRKHSRGCSRELCDKSKVEESRPRRAPGLLGELTDNVLRMPRRP